MAMKHVYKIELERPDLTPEQAAQAALERLKADGRRAELKKGGAAPVLLIDGGAYHLTVVSAPSSGIGAPCAVLKEQ